MIFMPKGLGLKKALIVTDKPLVACGATAAVTDLLDSLGIGHALYDGVEPNPTVEQVEAGLTMLREQGCDCVLSFGGGSPHDAAKGIAAVATSGGGMVERERERRRRGGESGQRKRRAHPQPPPSLSFHPPGSIRDYEGVDKLKAPMLPLVRMKREKEIKERWAGWISTDEKKKHHHPSLPLPPSSPFFPTRSPATRPPAPPAS